MIFCVKNVGDSATKIIIEIVINNLYHHLLTFIANTMRGWGSENNHLSTCVESSKINQTCSSVFSINLHPKNNTMDKLSSTHSTLTTFIQKKIYTFGKPVFKTGLPLLKRGIREASKIFILKLMLKSQIEFGQNSAHFEWFVI